MAIVSTLEEQMRSTGDFEAPTREHCDAVRALVAAPVRRRSRAGVASRWTAPSRTRPWST